MKKINLKKVLAVGLKCAFVAVTIHLACLVIKTNNQVKTVVEPYCAVRYEHNVVEYKQCKGLNPQELIEKLTDEATKTYDVPNLPILKG